MKFWNNFDKEEKACSKSAAATTALFCIIAIGIFIWFINRNRPYNPSDCLVCETYMMPETLKDSVRWVSVRVDSTNCIHAIGKIDSLATVNVRNGIVRKEYTEGRLLTTDEMVNRITGYYDKLIDVLIALFGVFSISSYFVISNKFSKRYEEDKENITDKIRKNLMGDHNFITTVINGASTKVQENFISEDDFTSIRQQLDKQKETIDLLTEYVNELTEDEAAKTVIDN